MKKELDIKTVIETFLLDDLHDWVRGFSWDNGILVVDAKWGERDLNYVIAGRIAHTLHYLFGNVYVAVRFNDLFTLYYIRKHLLLGYEFFIKCIRNEEEYSLVLP